MAAVFTAAITAWRGYNSMPDPPERCDSGQANVCASTHRAIPRVVPPGLAGRWSPTSTVKPTPDQQLSTGCEQVPQAVPDQPNHGYRRTRGSFVKTIQERLESLEARCDLFERALQQTRQEAAWRNFGEEDSNRSEDAPDTDLSHVITEKGHCQAAETKERQRRRKRKAARSRSPSTEQLLRKPVLEKKSRQRRATDLSIEGTPKLSLQGGGNTRRRLRRSYSWLG